MFYGKTSETLERHAEGGEGAMVRFTCAACGSGHDVSAVHVIWLLKALQLGDGQTSVAACAQVDDHACVRCGGTRWEAWPLPYAKAR